MNMHEYKNSVILGDCLDVCRSLPSQAFDLIYLDPPFFSGREHESYTRDGSQTYSFSDKWNHLGQYSDFMGARLAEFRRLLKVTGSIVVHCDSSANYILRLLLDEIYGSSNFRSEIIWRYKRWSNSQRAPIPSHQTLLFYSITDQYKYNQIFGDYSPTTNVDQILQARSRDNRGKSVYARSSDGEIKGSGGKRGVPISDVWDIPFLNPKAKERVGYPTQKPLLLLERVLHLLSDEGDHVLDPFCGSGTTLVSAQLNNRLYTGVDKSANAVTLTQNRLANPTFTKSNLLDKGEDSYQRADSDSLAILSGLPVVPVQRNNGIDALLKGEVQGDPVMIRVQRQSESIQDTVSAIRRASRGKKYSLLIVVSTQSSLFDIEKNDDDLIIVDSAGKAIYSAIQERVGSKLLMFADSGAA